MHVICITFSYCRPICAAYYIRQVTDRRRVVSTIAISHFVTFQYRMCAVCDKKQVTARRTVTSGTITLTQPAVCSLSTVDVKVMVTDSPHVRNVRPGAQRRPSQRDPPSASCQLQNQVGSSGQLKIRWPDINIFDSIFLLCENCCSQDCRRIQTRDGSTNAIM